MTNALPTSTESPEVLQKHLRAEPDAQRRQRWQALYWRASGPASARCGLAHRLAVPRHASRAGLTLDAAGGLQALLTSKQAPGKARTLSPAPLSQLRARLDDARGFASYGASQQDLAAEPQVHLSSSAGPALVRSTVQAKPKAPRRSPPNKSPQRAGRSSNPSARRSCPSSQGHRSAALGRGA